MVAHFQYILPSRALLRHKTSQTTHPGDNPIVSICHTGQLYNNRTIIIVISLQLNTLIKQSEQFCTFTMVKPHLTCRYQGAGQGRVGPRHMTEIIGRFQNYFT